VLKKVLNVMHSPSRQSTLRPVANGDSGLRPGSPNRWPGSLWSRPAPGAAPRAAGPASDAFNYG